MSIHQLPPEILSEILLRCLLNEYAQGGVDIALKRIQVSRLLACVCRLWHTLTLALPAHWASLHIKCDSHSIYPSIDVIGTHLQRSGTYPLAFSIHSQTLNHFNPFLPKALATLATARERWQSIFITLSAAPQSMIDAISQGPAPLLQVFHCEFVGHDSLEPSPIPLQGCPRLESLAWVGFHNRPLRLLGDSMWPHLTSLRLEASLSTMDCLTLLRLSPRLTTADLSCIVHPSRLRLHFVHDTLHVLRMKGSFVTTLLRALTLPALAHLHLDAVSVGIFGATRDTGLYSFLARSAPPLRTLTLSYVRYPEPELLQALGIVPALHALMVNNGDRLTAALVRALHPAPGGAVLCPCLRMLCISGAPSCRDGECGAMLRARWGADASANGVAVLEHAYIELRGLGHRADHEEICRLRDEGMVFGPLRAESLSEMCGG